MKQANNLAPADLILNGRHLIEASAGTGKTFNITRLYIRFLLEKKLSVQQILVMTFTKAATQELRGRIDKELRHALSHWGALGKGDPFFAKMESRFSKSEVEPVLKLALLELDEASIYTIHGFCNRVLSAQAFASGIDFDTQMETDTSELLLTATQDWLRQINDQSENFELLQQNNWHTPEQFLNQFGVAIRQSEPLSAVDSDKVKAGIQASMNDILDEFNLQKNKVKAELLAAKNEIFDALVENHKDRDKRQQEWQLLLEWLESRDDSPTPKAAVDFVNGNRYRKNESLKVLFEPFKQLKDQFKKTLDAICNRAEQQAANVDISQLVLKGIAQIKARFAQSKLKNSLMDFDDLVVQLSQLLLAEKAKLEDLANQSQNPESLAALTLSLKQEYPVALVDEFQDTDSAQYAILDCLYPSLKQGAKSAGQCLLMIGDPKQAIYGFRGGDIFTYLAARKQADYLWVMDTNWRSVADMVTAYNRLFWGNTLNSPANPVFGYNINYEQIKSTDHASANQYPLSDVNPERKALNYIWLEAVENPGGARGKALKEDYCQHLALWCTNEIIRLLNDAQLGTSPLTQQNIAILVKTGREAAIIQSALAQSGLASVYLSDRSNLFLSEQARQIEYLLAALLEVDNESLLIRAFSTRLFSFDAEQLRRFQDPEFQHEWEDAVNLATELKLIWQYKGVMSLLLHLIHHYYAANSDSFERELTNLMHLAEILQQASRQFKHPQQLLKWYKHQREQGRSEAEQRLESEANLIRIITQHSSKGLEYPVVFIPFANIYTDPSKVGKQTKQYFKFYDEANGLSAQQIGADDKVIEYAIRQGIAESIRLLYVAITRAEHRCYLGLAPFEQAEQSALAKAIGLDAATSWPQALKKVVTSSQGSSSFLALPEEIHVELFNQADQQQNNLQAQSFSSELNDSWRLYSFSKMTRNAHSSLNDKAYERLDQPVKTEDNPALMENAQRIQFTLKKGAAAGNLLHDILEYTDFSRANWQDTITEPLTRFGELSEDEIQALIEWLDSLIHAQFPLIDTPEHLISLAELPMQQTLREAEFYFPLAKTQVGLLMNLLKHHRQQEQGIYLPTEAELEGMMHGFIDLIFEYQGKFYVADYKSTHLGDDFNAYQHDDMKLNNQTHFYDLQYLIYSYALHKYLAGRLANYDFETHFGGVYYFYLRGMDKDNQQAFGVFQTEITTDEMTMLESVFEVDEEAYLS